MRNYEYLLLKDRYNRLSENNKNIKSPGVLKKIKRQLNRYEKTVK